MVRQVMKRKLTFILLLLMAMSFAVPTANALFFANVFLVSGTITLQGRPADPDQIVAAFIGEEKIAETKTRDNGTFELQIPEYDPTKPEVKGYHSSDDVIQVKLEGKKAKPTFNPNSDNLKIDLRVETTLDVKLSTWGKIKALFK